MGSSGDFREIGSERHIRRYVHINNGGRLIRSPCVNIVTGFSAYRVTLIRETITEFPSRTHNVDTVTYGFSIKESYQTYTILDWGLAMGEQKAVGSREAHGTTKRIKGLYMSGQTR
jgi:hypothetical protein